MLSSLGSYAMNPNIETESCGFVDFLVTVGGLAAIIAMMLSVAWLVI